MTGEKIVKVKVMSLVMLINCILKNEVSTTQRIDS